MPEVGWDDVLVRTEASALNLASPERSRLRVILVRRAGDPGAGGPVDLTELRKLVSALAQSSARHLEHRDDAAPTTSKHPCAR